uniref:Single-strand-selective monofunctional uracil-DNA glycosylase 1 n=1 Tax=Cairina moschata TaxID=8855 RepID=A0A8C3GFP2_CAIMO
MEVTPGSAAGRAPGAETPRAAPEVRAVRAVPPVTAVPAVLAVPPVTAAPAVRAVPAVTVAPEVTAVPPVTVAPAVPPVLAVAEVTAVPVTAVSEVPAVPAAPELAAVLAVPPVTAAPAVPVVPELPAVAAVTAVAAVPEAEDLAGRFLQLEREQSALLEELPPFGAPVSHVYRPLDYAWEPHRHFVRRYCRGPKRVLFLGMNPGPFGMAQNGVPFGETRHVREWLRVRGRVGKPRNEHPKRPVLGWECRRAEEEVDPGLSFPAYMGLGHP